MDIIGESEKLGIYQKWYHKLDDGNTFKLWIGQEVKDIDNTIATIIDKTSNSVYVFLKMKKNKNKQIEGISCGQWFTIADFIKRFKYEYERKEDFICGYGWGNC